MSTVNDSSQNIEKKICVWFLPDLIDQNQMAGSPTVVIDVLRATTTITSALAYGAQGIVPCVSVEQARTKKEALGPNALLGGERKGVPLPGFDLGNSPPEYQSVIDGKTLVLTTTNGTRALSMCHPASHIYCASFCNLDAVASHLMHHTSVSLVCSGTAGNITLEDVLFAGALVSRLTGNAKNTSILNDQAQIAFRLWKGLKRSQGSEDPDLETIVKHFEKSLGGSNLVKVGRESDLGFCAEINRFDLVPCFDSVNQEITAVPQIAVR